ncbi:O-methyltransferase [Arundinibacter roseus]|uniref:Class I SAM-dependent methyltransferase n=1 Tax=Arundinibacter roseus TaxID=2070510 RepID=A0A4R4KLN6_9BACT|nr:class I SAM-dependent methyltransferase [Arundinibacter roseus]TDB67876.1 class I SAM-dependent methyltransferase [Arundinibacter roseus]
MGTLKDTLSLYAGVVRRVGYTLTVGLGNAQERNRLLALYQVYAQPTTLEDPTPDDPHILPKTDILELLKNDEAVYEGVNECGFGHTTEFELKVISNLVRMKQPKRIFEIGTFQGRTTLNMALNSPADAQIVTLDLPGSELDNTQMKIAVGEARYVKKDRSGERFLEHPLRSKIQQVFGDSATFDFSPYKASMDLIFIDASHAYEYVLNDTQKALEMIRPGGIILWHDYTNWEGVRNALNELYQKNPSCRNLRHIGGTSIALLQL